MNLLIRNFILIASFVFPVFLNAQVVGTITGSQTATFAFVGPTVTCETGTVCYDVTLNSNIADGSTPFGLASYNLDFFYDASRLLYVPAIPPNINNLSAISTYVLGGIQNTPFVNGQLAGINPASGMPFGNLSFDATLGLLQIPVDYIPTTPVTISGAPVNILNELCFTIIDQTILTDPTSCFDLLWVNEVSRQDYVGGSTSLLFNNTNSGLPPDPDGGMSATIDVEGSTYIDLTSDTNCLATDCVMNPCVPIVDADGDGVCDVGLTPDADPEDPDPEDPCVPNPNSEGCIASMIQFELDFTDGIIDCANQIICYDITIEAPVDFDLGSYNLRLFYDADLLDLIDMSPNLGPGTQLNTSYNITSLNDMQQGDLSGNNPSGVPFGSLPFDDNLDVIDIAVDFLGTNPIVATQTPTIITNDLCFNIVDPALIDDPAVCIHAVWVTNTTEEFYTVGETTVNVAIGNGVTTDIDGSIYNDLDPTGDQCLVDACVDVGNIPTMGEWGLISLAIILMIFGIVAIRSENIITSRKVVQ